MGISQLFLGADRDPYWDNVVLLVNATGATLGATTFADKSKYNNTITTAGSAVISNGQSIVDGKSIYFPNPPTDSGISFNGSQSHFNFGNGSLTIETFRYIPIGTVNAFVYRFNTSGGNSVSSFLSSSNHNIGFVAGSSVVGTLSGYAFEGNVWRHEALVYDASVVPGFIQVSFYCNGIRYFNNSYAVGTGLVLSGTCTIGYRTSPTGNSLNGYEDQFRITKGIARYSGATIVTPNIPFATS